MIAGGGYPPAMSNRSAQHELVIYLSSDALELLKKLDYPCSERVLASARRVEGLEDEGLEFELNGSRGELERMAGFVAGDANHADRRKKRKLALLYAISEALESAL